MSQQQFNSLSYTPQLEAIRKVDLLLGLLNLIAGLVGMDLWALYHFRAERAAVEQTGRRAFLMELLRCGGLTAFWRVKQDFGGYAAA
jgi:hypothetical protein